MRSNVQVGRGCGDLLRRLLGLVNANTRCRLRHHVLRFGLNDEIFNQGTIHEWTFLGALRHSPACIGFECDGGVGGHKA